MTIEPMQPDDWPAVALIYEDGLDVGTFEEAVPSWQEWDAAHLAHPRLVARNGGAVVAWAAVGAISRRACYRGVVESSIYVAQAVRGRGVGRALLAELVAQADAAGLWTVQAVTFADNAASIALHEACGFRQVGVRERLAQKRGEWRDVVLLERRSPLVA